MRDAIKHGSAADRAYIDGQPARVVCQRRDPLHRAPELDDGIRAHVVVSEGARIVKPVHLCFGVLPKSGLQRILMNVEVRDESNVSIIAHCTFTGVDGTNHPVTGKGQLTIIFADY